MDCKEIRPLMVPFMEGEFSGAYKEEIARHLEGCVHCQEEMQLISKTWQLLDHYGVPKVREGFTASVMARVSLEAPEPVPAAFGASVFSVRTLVLASMALVLVGALAYYRLFPTDRLAQKPVQNIQMQVASETEEKIGQEQAVVTYLTGSVKVLLGGQQEYADAEQGMILRSGDTVMTGLAGAMEMSFDSGNNKIVRMQADTKAAITLQGNEKMMLYDGEVFATIHNLPAHSSFEIRTPTAITGARGTAWATRVSAGSTTIESFERTPYIKSIEMTGRISAEETKVATGYSTVVGRLQKPQPLQPIQAGKMAHYTSLVNDIRQHAEQDLVTRQMRPKFDRNNFIKKITDNNQRKAGAKMRDDRSGLAGSEPGAEKKPQDRHLPRTGPGGGGVEDRPGEGPDRQGDQAPVGARRQGGTDQRADERGRGEEMQQGRHDQVDQNGDNVIDTAELQAWSERQQRQSINKDEGAEDRSGGPGPGDQGGRQDGSGMGQGPGMRRGPGMGQGEHRKGVGPIMDSGPGGPGGSGGGPSGDPYDRGLRGPSPDQGQERHVGSGGQGRGFDRGGPGGHDQGLGKSGGPGGKGGGPGGSKPSGGSPSGGRPKK